MEVVLKKELKLTKLTFSERKYLMKWYVYFINRLGKKDCHCFEGDEKQAKHFASLVNGQIYVEN